MGLPLLNHETKVLKALANRKRLEIVQLLHRHSLTLSDIQRMTEVRQANLSQHLAVLKAAQVIIAERHSRNIRYRLAHPNFALIKTLLHQAISKKTLRISRVPEPALKVKDVVCSMMVVPSSAEWKTIHKGATYYFCASGCYRKFMKQPAVYVN